MLTIKNERKTKDKTVLVKVQRFGNFLSGMG